MQLAPTVRVLTALDNTAGRVLLGDFSTMVQDVDGQPLEYALRRYHHDDRPDVRTAAWWLLFEVLRQVAIVGDTPRIWGDVIRPLRRLVQADLHCLRRELGHG